MGRLLSKKGGLPSPRLCGPAEEHRIPGRLKTQGEIPSWKQATRKFTSLVQWFEEFEETAHQALNYEAFTDNWARAAWSDLYWIDQQACKWAESTVLITLSGSYWLDKDTQTFCPPVTYIEALQKSKQARQKALSRVLDDVSRWQSIRAIGGQGNNGYPRIFVGLYLSSPVEKNIFSKVLQAHINNSPVAGADAHTIETVVSVQNTPQHKSQLVHALGKQIPGLESSKGILSESWDKQKVATVLHAGKWRPYTFGQSI